MSAPNDLQQGGYGGPHYPLPPTLSYLSCGSRYCARLAASMNDINQRNVFGSNVVNRASMVLTLRREGETLGFVKGVAAAIIGGLIVDLIVRFIG